MLQATAGRITYHANAEGRSAQRLHHRTATSNCGRRRVMAPSKWRISDWKRVRLAAYIALFRSVDVYRGDDTIVKSDVRLVTLRDSYYEARYGTLTRGRGFGGRARRKRLHGNDRPDQSNKVLTADVVRHLSILQFPQWGLQADSRGSGEREGGSHTTTLKAVSRGRPSWRGGRRSTLGTRRAPNRAG
jgi:hypothetical protein